MIILLVVALLVAALPMKAKPEQHPGIETVAGIVEGPAGLR